MKRSERENVFRAIRQALAGVPQPAPLPEFDEELVVARGRLDGGDLWEAFSRQLQKVHGRAFDSVDLLQHFLLEAGCREGYCDPQLQASVGAPLARAGLSVHLDYDRASYDRYEFGITRATGAIAETGTLILDDDTTADRLAALTPWIHVGVIRRTEIRRTVSDALAALGESVNTVWCTGPSKTADIEGILIEGVHGPGEQICLCLNEIMGAP